MVLDQNCGALLTARMTNYDDVGINRPEPQGQFINEQTQVGILDKVQFRSSNIVLALVVLERSQQSCFEQGILFMLISKHRM